MGAGLGRGVVVLWLSVIVLLPLAAMLDKSLSEGLGHFWDQVSQGRARQSLELILVCSLIVVAINAVFGTIVAWLLVRDN
ncbi:MAG TPA: molybdate ABC transporter permease subunit, partial [Solirubrobacterales bacterium]|nr:molybdate ABC transporter permease subunit [Solirubrobacterales bacterium]